MTPENFVYWLQGFFEIADSDLNKKNMADSLSSQQVQMIKDHLKLVFEKQTPDRTTEIKTTKDQYEEIFEEVLKKTNINKVPKPPYDVTCGNPFKKEYC